MKKIIGQVTYEEKEQISSLFEKKVALENMLLMDIKEIQNKVILDLHQINEKMQNWWYKMGLKYQWTVEENAQWEIDFNTREIVLSKEKDV